MNPLKHFRWYRRLRGGRWAQVTGWLFGKRWVRVPAVCIERVDEDYRPSVYQHSLGHPSRHWPGPKDVGR